jgi:hypothetical protein
MTKIITCSELRYLTLAELEALFRTLQIELGLTGPGSPERGIVLTSLESVRRALAERLTRQPNPRLTPRQVSSRFADPAASRRRPGMYLLWRSAALNNRWDQ